VAGAEAAIEKLQTLGVIAAVEPYRSIVRLRNLIVHEYEEIDPRLLYPVVTEQLDDILRFRDEIDQQQLLPLARHSSGANFDAKC